MLCLLFRLIDSKEMYRCIKAKENIKMEQRRLLERLPVKGVKSECSPHDLDNLTDKGDEINISDY